MKKEGLNPAETSSLSAIEHVLAHRPELILSLRLADRPSPRTASIESLAREQGVGTSRDRSLEPGAAIALLSPLPLADLKPLLAKLEPKKRSVLVALDHIQDPQNLGAICRTAEALGVDGLIFPRHRSVTVTGAVFAASAGAVATLPLCVPGGLNEALRQCKDAGYWLVGSTLAPESTEIAKMPDFEKIVLIMGSEGDGLSEHTAKLCDWKLRIPLRGSVQSLNVSAAGAILISNLMARFETP